MLVSSAPRTIWHYTSAETLLKILDSKSLHLTCYDFLNDPSEGQIGHELVQDCWGRTLDSAGKGIASLEALRKHAREVPRARYVRQEQQCTFVFSGSSMSDSLSQWARYGDDGRGVAVGIRIDPNRFSELPLNKGWCFGPHLSPVTYWEPTAERRDGSSEMDSLPAQLEQSLLHFLSNVTDPTDLENGLFMTAERLAPCVKSSSYSEEAEVRLYLSTSPAAKDLFQMKMTPHGLAPIVAVPLGFGAIKIVALTLGPAAPRERIWAVKHWLTSKFDLEDIEVKQSQLSYRGGR